MPVVSADDARSASPLDRAAASADARQHPCVRVQAPPTHRER